METSESNIYWEIKMLKQCLEEVTLKINALEEKTKKLKKDSNAQLVQQQTKRKRKTNKTTSRK